MNYDYDLVVIGAGPGGYVCAIRAADAGLRVALVEKEHAGGLCLTNGCIPSKIQLKDAAVLWRAKKMIATGRVEGYLNPIFTAWISHADTKVKGIRESLEQLITSRGVTLIKGTARLTSPHDVTVAHDDGTTTSFSAESVVLATGAHPRQLPSLPFDGERIITSKEALWNTALPKTMVIVGGGVIGCEMATWFSALGTKVTIIELAPQLLPGTDADVSKTLSRAFGQRDITVRLSTEVTGHERTESGIALTLKNGERIEHVETERVLVAAGILGNIEGLELETFGIETFKDFLLVDPQTYRTNVDNVYAIGDVIRTSKETPHPGLAHVASAEGEIAAEVIAHGKARWRVDYDNIPLTIFTDPEIGITGTSQVNPELHDVQILRDSWMGIGMALDEPPGFTKQIVNKKDGTFAGVHIIGANACDRIHEYTIARRAEETVRTMSRQIMAHPTWSETVREALLALDGRAVHVPLMQQKKRG